MPFECEHCGADVVLAHAQGRNVGTSRRLTVRIDNARSDAWGRPLDVDD